MMFRFLRRFKISGSAAKLARNKAYHHFTLLINSNLSQVSHYLSPEPDNLKCKATASLRSSVANLQDIYPAMTVACVEELVIAQYSKYHTNTRCYDINTSDEDFAPGVSAYAEQLMDWEWIFGRTPAFEITLKHKMLDSEEDFLLSLSIHKGLIQHVELLSPYSDPDFEYVASLLASFLVGCKLTYQDVKLCFHISAYKCENTVQSHYFWKTEELLYSFFNLT